MIYELAKPEDLRAVYNVVQHTIKTIYPKYYPVEVVGMIMELLSVQAVLVFIKKLTRIPQPLQAGDELCKALPG